MSRLSVGIVGCGWLGKALLKQLQREQHQVIATYRSEQTKEQLLSLYADVEYLSLPLLKTGKNEFRVFDQDVIIVAIPPRLRHSTDYPVHIKQLVDVSEQSSCKHIILISSTAIYNGLVGDVDENSELNFDGDKVKYLHQAERYVASFSRQSSILRLAGLIGPERHPSRFVKAGKVSGNPNNAINLIHQMDVVGLILKIIETTQQPPFDNKDNIYNGVADLHCSRKAFYEAAANSKELDLPIFSNKQTIESRTVDSTQTRNSLDYKFQLDDLLTWLKD